MSSQSSQSGIIQFYCLAINAIALIYPTVRWRCRLRKVGSQPSIHEELWPAWRRALGQIPLLRTSVPDGDSDQPGRSCFLRMSRCGMRPFRSSSPAAMARTVSSRRCDNGPPSLSATDIRLRPISTDFRNYARDALAVLRWDSSISPIRSRTSRLQTRRLRYAKLHARGRDSPASRRPSSAGFRVRILWRRPVLA